MVTEDGVRVIEATTRFSGGFDCQYLVPAATGKNILRAGILTCTGSHEPLSPYLRAQWNKVALSESLWPPLGRIVSIKGLAGAGRIPGVELIVFRKKVGDEVTPYIDCATRVCFIITSGNTEEEAREVMEKAKQTIKVEVA
jgi:biotin carboxylase